MPLATMPSTSSTGSLNDILSLFRDSKGSQTTQTNLSPDAITAIINSMMNSNQGLAAIAGGQHSAGLYNSTVNTQLVNDLISNVGTKAALAGAPTTVSKTGNAPLGGQIGNTLGSLLTADTLYKKFTGDSLLESLGFMGNTAAAATDAASVVSTGDALGSWLGGTAGMADALTPSIAAGPIGAVVDAFGTTAAGTGSVVTGDAMAELIGTEAVGASPGIAGTVGTAADAAIGTAAGAAGTGLSSAAATGIAGAATGAAIADAAMGSAIMGPAVGAGLDIIGGTAAATAGGGGILAAIGELLTAVASLCFITTATVTVMGKADDCDELQTLRKFRDTWLKDNHPEEIKIYYDTAPAIVDRINGLKGARHIYTDFYISYIVPAVEAIKEGKNEEAYKIYTELYYKALDLSGD